MTPLGPTPSWPATAVAPGRAALPPGLAPPPAGTGFAAALNGAQARVAADPAPPASQRTNPPRCDETATGTETGTDITDATNTRDTKEDTRTDAEATRVASALLDPLRPLLPAEQAFATAATTDHGSADIDVLGEIESATGAGSALPATGAKTKGLPRADRSLRTTPAETPPAAVEREGASASALGAAPAAATPLAAPPPSATLLTGERARQTGADAPPPGAALPPVATGREPTPANAAATAPPPFAAHLSAALDSPSFAPALATQVRWLVHEGIGQAQLTLNPPEMGPLAVRIVVEAGQARIDFRADLAATRSAIEASLPSLAAALGESGLTLSGGGVFDGQPRHDAPAREPAEHGTSAAPHASPSAMSLPSSPSRSAARGLVDLVA